MTEPDRRSSTRYTLRRLWWLMALKIVILAFAIYVVLRAYHLV